MVWLHGKYYSKIILILKNQFNFTSTNVLKLFLAFFLQQKEMLTLLSNTFSRDSSCRGQRWSGVGGGRGGRQMDRDGKDHLYHCAWQAVQRH